MRRGILVLLLVLAACLVAADGMVFYTERNAKPTIPSQRAIIVHKDGLETLFVESTLDGPAGDYAWVLPVPSKPVDIQPATTGTLDTVQEVLRPQIAHTSYVFIPLAWGVLLYCLSLMVLMWVPPQHRHRKRAEKLSRVLHVFIPFCCCFSVPLEGPSCAATGPPTPKLAPHWQTVGSYDVAVLHGASSEAITSWLRTNGFAVTSDAEKPIASYTSEGWYFLAAKLKVDKAGHATPHPLRVQFRVKDPVYPMRLTAAAGVPVHLDLTVIAGKRAYCPGLRWIETEYCQIDPAPRSFPRFDDARPSRPAWKPTGHPQLTPLMWERAAMTRLRGTLLPSQQHTDLTFKWSARGDGQAWAGSAYQAWAGAIGLGVTVLALGTTLVAWWCGYRPGRPMAAATRLGLCTSFPIALAASWAVYASVEQVELVRGNPGGLWEPADELSSYLNKSVTPEPGESFADAFRKMVKPVKSRDPDEGLYPRFTEGDHPGGFTIEKDLRGWKLTAYDEYARPFLFIATDLENPTDPRAHHTGTYDFFPESKYPANPDPQVHPSQRK